MVVVTTNISERPRRSPALPSLVKKSVSLLLAGYVFLRLYPRISSSYGLPIDWFTSWYRQGQGGLIGQMTLYSPFTSYPCLPPVYRLPTPTSIHMRTVRMIALKTLYATIYLRMINTPMHFGKPQIVFLSLRMPNELAQRRSALGSVG